MRKLGVMVLLLSSACVGPAGPEGPPGPAGTDGADGSDGSDGSASAPADQFASGQRIKVRTTTTTTETPDGATRTLTYFAGWFDSMRNEPCAPSRASDGVMRCLPAAEYAYGYYFADAVCTVPLAQVYGSCMPPAPKYIAQYPAPSCPASDLGPRLFAAGALVTSYYQKSGTSCTGPMTNTSPSYVLYPIMGAEIPATSFAEMTVTSTTAP